MKLARKWHIYLIHHSHTDIGYTDPQEKIIKYHVDFILQVIDILDNIYDTYKDNIGFKWQCENYWQVQNFYAKATEEQKQKFESYVKKGDIGLSGNYLNMTELASDSVVRSMLAKVKKYSQTLGVNISSAMTADINGYSWGFADQLIDAGVQNLISCIHTHHGMFPIYKKQQPILWEAPSGKTLFTWISDHYHLGNELCLSPYGETSYTIHDEFSDYPTAFDPVQIASTRITRYLNNLDRENYSFDFVPVMVSGGITDNSYPNRGIVDRCSEIMTNVGNQLVIQMVTLDEFFAIAKSKVGKIVTHKGDWNDWWADGVGSTPGIVKLYKDSERKLELISLLSEKDKIENEQLLDLAKQDMMMYAEHTWGYSSSVLEPWDSKVNELELKKSLYAINSNKILSELLINVLEHYGEKSISANGNKEYLLINPFEHTVEGCVKLLLYTHDRIGDRKAVQIPREHFEVVDCDTNCVINSQIKRITAGFEIYIYTKLQAKETQKVFLRTKELHQINTVKNHAYIGADGVEDIANSKERNALETKQFRIELDNSSGIRSIIYKKDCIDLIRPLSEYKAFTGIYEFTPITSDVCTVRRNMGRNRKSSSTLRYSAKLLSFDVLDIGDIYNTIQLNYELEGTKLYSIIMKVYEDIPRIDCTIRIHKASEVAPENLYVSLPFTTGEEEVKYIDKSGCIIRPGIDQLPGSNKEFYLLQNGICLVGQTRSMVITIKDAPLVVFDQLEASPIQLCSGKDIKFNTSTSYSWIMNNFWETNFKVDLGGFYEFDYSVFVYEDSDVKSLFRKCREQNINLFSIRI